MKEAIFFIFLGIVSTVMICFSEFSYIKREPLGNQHTVIVYSLLSSRAEKYALKNNIPFKKEGIKTKISIKDTNRFFIENS